MDVAGADKLLHAHVSDDGVFGFLMTRYSSIIFPVVAVLAFALSVFQLERQSLGFEITKTTVGSTPVTVLRRPDADGPAILIAHGFAGSRQLMQGFAQSLAKAGYQTVSLDLMGHGRNPVPMSGDVAALEGTTRLLVEELRSVAEYALELPGTSGRLGVLGHSMASDLVVRLAVEDERVDVTVAVSAFSTAITETEPNALLIINGALERVLRAEARRVMAQAGAEEGQTTDIPLRRAVAAPGVEHVGVLFSKTSYREAREWFDGVFGAQEPSSTYPMPGLWLLLGMFSAAALAFPIARILPKGEAHVVPKGRDALIAGLVPALVVPAALRLLDTDFLPVLVADYLAVHMGLYGLMVIGLLRWRGYSIPRPEGWLAGLVLMGLGLGLLGGFIDRYAAAFWPVGVRWAIFASIALGAVPMMLADSILRGGGAARWRRSLWVRLAFLASLGIAVFLDLEALFFLLMIIPLIAVFYGTFGTIASAIGMRSRSIWGPGVGLGIVLAWALSVTFPLFQA